MASISADPALVAWLPGQRWFGGKGRSIERVAEVDHARLDGGSPARLAIIAVHYASGRPERYFLASRQGHWSDALADDGFCRSILGWIAAGARLPTARGGVIVCSPGPALDEHRGALRAAATVRRLSGEQSNTSIVFDDELILKVFRRLHPGVNPEVEVLRFLAERTGFRHVPRLAGTIEYRCGSTRYSLGLVQTFEASEADGWTWALERVRHGATSEDDQGGLEAVAALGRVTAGLHLALASDPFHPHFAPCAIERGEVARWKAGADARLRRALRRLAADLDALPAVARALGSSVLASEAVLRRTLDGLDALAESGALAARVHGDYHLGQVLRTASTWVIVDFEGEPLRPIAERRARHTPLKDVAGMLRSFSYARYAVLRAHLDAAPAVCEAWEQAARRAFLDAYVGEVRAAGARLIPAGDDALCRALAALEVEKALYELEYELGNRPGWAEIPLRFLAAR